MKYKEEYLYRPFESEEKEDYYIAVHQSDKGDVILKNKYGEFIFETKLEILDIITMNNVCIDKVYVLFFPKITELRPYVDLVEV